MNHAAVHSHSSSHGHENHELNSPETVNLHARIIRKKPLLESFYIRAYRELLRTLPENPSAIIVELGSGGGFLKEYLPRVITTDVVSGEGIDRVVDALDIPFVDASVDVFFMIDVFHHINDSARFLSELKRCLKPGGQVLMIEPANTLFSSFVYRNFHHEAFNTDGGWTFESTGRLTSANGAQPWIVFHRDRERFDKDFPEMTVTRYQNHTPISYLLSGGLSKPSLPAFMTGFILFLELLMTPLNNLTGMFSTIHIKKAG